MRTNELCTYEQHKQGYSSHHTSYGVILYYQNSIMQFPTEDEMQEYLNEISDSGDDDWFNDGTTYGSDGSEHK